jgi:hypothetical protein
MHGESRFQSSSSLLPAGKLVMVVDDDDEFQILCLDKLERFLTELAPEGSKLDFLLAGSLKKFEALLDMLMAEKREEDLIYALVDLKLPSSERGTEQDDQAMFENGKLVYGRLRQLKVPTLLISGAARREVFDIALAADRAHFLPKEKFYNDETAKDVAIQILCAKHRTPSITVDPGCCESIESPLLARGKKRCLPLAFESPTMAALRTRICSKGAKEAAAVLLLGESGVEFEQLAWLLFREITKTHGGGEGPAYQYCPFNCESVGSPAVLLERNREGLKDPQGEQLRRFLFIENLECLGASELAAFCDALAQSPCIRVGGDRMVLTVANEKKEGAERLLDLFCLAGFDDFILLDVPDLSRRRPEDIAVYAEYYRRQRMEDKQESTLLFDQRALNLIMDLDYRRHFKQLSIFLDELFRTTNGDIITANDVRAVASSRFVETAVRGVVDHILTSGTEESNPGTRWSGGQLYVICSQLLVHRKSRSSSAFLKEDEDFYHELEQIVEALEHASRLGTEEGTTVIDELQVLGPHFWPWSRYPVSPRLLKQLQRHGLTVGLVPY